MLCQNVPCVKAFFGDFCTKRPIPGGDFTNPPFPAIIWLVRTADGSEVDSVHFQLYFELIGVVAFAISGAVLGSRKGMDLFGVAMMGMTTAVGGGILRDVLLGLTPPAALRDPLQALVGIAVSLVVFIVWQHSHPGREHRWQEALLLVADSIGLGIFTAHGVAVAMQAGYDSRVFLVLFVGVVTGVGGGVLRDVCCMERPYIFTKHIYALASLAGAAVCMLLWTSGQSIAMLTSCALTVVLRVCAAAFRWSLHKARP